MVITWIFAYFLLAQSRELKIELPSSFPAGLLIYRDFLLHPHSRVASGWPLSLIQSGSRFLNAVNKSYLTVHFFRHVERKEMHIKTGKTASRMFDFQTRCSSSAAASVSVATCLSI